MNSKYQGYWIFFWPIYSLLYTTYGNPLDTGHKLSVHKTFRKRSMNDQLMPCVQEERSPCVLYLVNTNIHKSTDQVKFRIPK